MTVLINGVSVKAKKWNRMPHQGRYDPVAVRVNGERREAQLTEGGVPIKKYSYFIARGQVYYVKGHLESGAEIRA